MQCCGGQLLAALSCHSSRPRQRGQADRVGVLLLHLSNHFSFGCDVKFQIHKVGTGARRLHGLTLSLDYNVTFHSASAMC